MSNIRHTVIVRRDLNLVTGLLAAQVAHISDQFTREKILSGKSFSPVEKQWLAEPYLSVLAVNNVDELNIIKEEAQAAGLKVHVWDDVVPSEILKRPIRTVIGISIGPDDFDRIKMITGNLPLC